MQIFIAFLLMGFLFQGALAADDLIDEVFALPKPERFKARPIDDIVKKYIPDGVNRDQARQVLLTQGFKVFDRTLEEAPSDCQDCDELFIGARYDHRPMFSLIYDYGIVVRIGFRKNTAVSVHGWFVKNAY